MTIVTGVRQVTRTVGGHRFTLTLGRRYLATRPFADKYQESFEVSIADTTDGVMFDAAPVATVTDLSYDDANALLAEFNEGSFTGLIW